MLFKVLVITSQKTQGFAITQFSYLILHRKIRIVNCANHTNCKIPLCGQKAFPLTSVDAVTEDCASKCQVTKPGRKSASYFVERTAL
jgi:hypothetical protein